MSAVTISHVRLELGREKDHPFGAREVAYDLYLPLTDKGAIDSDALRRLGSRCRVRKLSTGADEARGFILRSGRGRWVFFYPDHGCGVTEPGFSLADNALAIGKDIAIDDEDGRTRPFQIVSIKPQ